MIVLINNLLASHRDKYLACILMSVLYKLALIVNSLDSKAIMSRNINVESLVLNICK